MKFIPGAFILLLGLTVSLIISFKSIDNEAAVPSLHIHFKNAPKPATKISEIPLPDGYTRIAVQQGSFAEWLRNFPLRADNVVYLYNGKPVEYQNWHYAVLDISTGSKDLQQCADAIMRLKAEYYFSKGLYDSIEFRDGKDVMNFGKYLANSLTNAEERQTNMRRLLLMSFMEKVFINCGTYTVDAMTKPLPLTNVMPGDVFVKAGSPGHAMIVMDVAQNTDGQKIFMLAQSYMPAQDMHVVINPMNTTLSPWYAVMNYDKIITPGWMFDKTQLKRWK